MQYTSVGISLDYTYAIIQFNNAQRIRAWFAAIETKIAIKEKPIIQQFGFSEGKSEVMNYTRCFAYVAFTGFNF